MNELKIDGQMTVEELKQNFKELFGGTLRVYKDNKGHLADDSQPLSTLNTNDAPATGEFLCRASITVAGFCKRMLETYGITVKVATVDDWVTALDDITLANVGRIPKQATKETMEQFRSKYGKKVENANSGSPTSEHDTFYIENLMDWLKKECNILTDDEVYYNASFASAGLIDKKEIEMFINNVKAQMCEEDRELLEKLSFKTAEDFSSYLDEDEDGICLAQVMVAAAYCTAQKIEIDDETEMYVDDQKYIICDGRDFYYEYETDIDLG